MKAPAHQDRWSMALALAILSLWTALHLYALFFHDLAANPLMSVLLFVALTWLSVGLFITAHDAMHGSLLSRNRKLGDYIGALALFLYAGFSYRKLLPSHHRHHATPNGEDDPDTAPSENAGFWRWFGHFILSYYGSRENTIMILRTLLYLALGATVANILIFYAATACLAAFQLFYFGTYLPHHRQETAFADHHNARSNEYSYFASLISCFHFGYHHEHHLYPQMPWWYLPAVRKQRTAS